MEIITTDISESKYGVSRITGHVTIKKVVMNSFSWIKLYESFNLKIIMAFGNYYRKSSPEMRLIHPYNNAWKKLIQPDNPIQTLL